VNSAASWGLPHRLSAYPILHPSLRAEGRITKFSSGGAALHYGGSGFCGEFFGRSLAFCASAEDHPVSLGVRIDGGAEIILDLEGRARQVHQAAVGLDKGRHRVEVYRRSDAWRGAISLEAVLVDQGAELGDLPPERTRKLAFFGDSILAGGLVHAVGFEGLSDELVSTSNPGDRLTNGRLGFGALAAEKLGAEGQVNGIGGLAVLDGTGWYCLPDALGWETTWDKLNPVKGSLTPWEFGQFSPRLIVCSLGQNCAKDGDIHDPKHRERWVKAYLSILTQLHAVQSRASFLLTTTIMNHDPLFDQTLEEVGVRARAAGLEVTTYRFSRVGMATPGHLRWAEEEEMASELAEAIEGMDLDWDRDPRATS
jgi:hypothetical protein